MKKINKSGICIFIGFCYSEEVSQSGSSQVELMAAMKGLEILSDIEKIRIVTDSQYVRKGLTEWSMYWKLNEWYTANGNKVKKYRKLEII